MSKEAPKVAELEVITQTYELTREITERVRGFPRDLRFVLGDRMLNTVYSVLDVLIEARYSSARGPLLARSNILLEQLRFQIRLAVDVNLLNARQYEFLAERVRNVGRMVGGWIKSL